MHPCNPLFPCCAAQLHNDAGRAARSHSHGSRRRRRHLGAKKGLAPPIQSHLVRQALRDLLRLVDGELTSESTRLPIRGDDGSIVEVTFPGFVASTQPNGLKQTAEVAVQQK